MIINHNLMAMNANRNMNINSSNASKAMAKLSSGMKINSAADDAAGLAISEKMRSQINGLDQASSNAQDAISLAQTAEGALNETTSILQRMRDLSVQAANDTTTDSDREAMQSETKQLKSEIDRISSTTQFNTKNLLDGSLSSAQSAQGTVANSSIMKAAVTAATSGTARAGLAAALSNASSGTTGTGYSVTAGNALAENTIIQAGVNDSFDITINGNTYHAKLDASPTGGYKSADFVAAVNSSIKNAVGTAAWANQQNQAIASISDNHLVITSATAGSSNNVKVSVADSTSGMGATEAMGFSKSVSSINCTQDLSAGYKFNASTKSKFTVTLGNSAVFDIDLANDGNLADNHLATTGYSINQLETALQTALDKKVGSGAITVGDDKLGHLTFTSNVATGSFSIKAGTSNSISADLIDTSGTIAVTAGAAANNVTASGVNTVDATAAGTYISSGANDKFSISVDGGAVETLTLKSGNYATRNDLLNEVNNEINSNNNLVGKVTAQLGTDGKISFVSSSTGSSSSVNLTDPTNAAQSALGALGYEGYAGQVTGSIDLKNGVDLTAAGATKLSVTLGANQNVTIDLAGSTGINTSKIATSGTEALLNAPTAGTDLSATLSSDKLDIKIDGTDHYLTGGAGGALSTLGGDGKTYSTSDLVAAINTAISGAGTAALVGGKIQITSASTGTSSKVAVSYDAGTSAGAKTAIGGAFGFAGTETSTDGVAASTAEQGSSRDAIVNALQSKFDTAFGKGAVTVNTSTAANGSDTLIITNNTRASAFSIGSTTGATDLFGGSQTASVSANGSNFVNGGTDEVKNTLSNSTLLTGLANSDGNNLGLTEGNVINISGTQNGDGFSTSLTVTNTSTIGDVLNSLRNLSQFQGATVALDTTSGKITVTGANGATKDISNLKFTAQASATDSTQVGKFNTEFNGFNVTQKAQDASSDKSLTMQIGANQGQTMNVDIGDMSTKALKLQDIDLSTQKGAETATSVIDNAINVVSGERAKLGAFQNRLEHTINNLGTSSQNLTSAESGIRDVDMASEMANYSKLNVLTQAAQAMLAQANQQPQQVLQLLR